MTCAGAFVAPTLTTAYLLAEETAQETTRTRAGAWVNAAVNAGSSTGSVTAGLLIGRVSLWGCFVLAGAVAVVTASACRPAVPTRAGLTAGQQTADGT
jgi:MFS family permease